MQRVEIGLEDSFPWGGGVLISTSESPTNGAALSHKKKTGSKALLKKIIN